MTTSNHLYAGAALALVIPQPAIALVAALASHFLLDALPHYGQVEKQVVDWFKYKATWLVEGLNLVGVPLLVYLLWGQPAWVFAAVLLAILPDSVWLYHHFRKQRGHEVTFGRLTRFHDRIQWGERPWGALVEVPAFILLAVVVAQLAR